MSHDTDLLENATDARMTEILAAVREVFASKGFDGASMQDLARAAHMSAGNFYRYFSSKEAIIEAMVRRDLTEIAQKFSSIMESDDPLQTMRSGIVEQLDEVDCSGMAIWCETIAASNRREQIGAIRERFEAAIQSYLTIVLGRIAGVSEGEAQARFQAHGTMLFILIQGIKMRRRDGDGFPDSRLRALTLEAIDSILDTVIREGGKTA